MLIVPVSAEDSAISFIKHPQNSFRPDTWRWLKGWIMERRRELQMRSTATPIDAVGSPLPICPSHPGSRVRRYRSLGPNGSGVYPQCLPADGSQPHLFAWSEAPPASIERSKGSALSPAEFAVLQDAANGLTVTETALRQSKGRETVKTQRHTILLKLGARNIAQAVAMMISDGLIANTDIRTQPVTGY
jgi:DNA-binding CsgD family transcriptional regulator